MFRTNSFSSRERACATFGNFLTHFIIYCAFYQKIKSFLYQKKFPRADLPGKTSTNLHAYIKSDVGNFHMISSCSMLKSNEFLPKIAYLAAAAAFLSHKLLHASCKISLQEKLFHYQDHGNVSKSLKKR